MKEQSLNYQKLEFMTHAQLGKPKKFSVVSTLSRICMSFVQSILAVNELKICSHKNRLGTTYWQIDNLYTGRKVVLSSEAEVRAWLDRRYYD